MDPSRRCKPDADDCARKIRRLARPVPGPPASGRSRSVKRAGELAAVFADQFRLVRSKREDVHGGLAGTLAPLAPVASHDLEDLIERRAVAAGDGEADGVGEARLKVFRPCIDLRPENG